jgi:hypothetical protein
MSEKLDISSCIEFQAQLPDLIASGEDISDQSHFQSCENCRAVMADLETIAEAARQLFPIAEPPDDLWEQIELGMRDKKASPD